MTPTSPRTPARHRRLAIPASVLALGLVASACSKSETKDTTASSAVSQDSTAAATDAAAGAAKGAVKEMSGVKSAVVQLLVEGEMREADEGAESFKGSGSGFLIDAEGTIVTNNHVVTGAGAITVRVGGDTTVEIPAKVLGVSECSDLALVKLSSPGPYPFLQWSSKDIVPPLEIYAAGFPLGDPEYTVTRGVVSKAKAAGDTPWASITHVIEHDANIQPGNSGGPLVDAGGSVVGVNYAGGDIGGTGTSQFFAIANDLAKPTIEQLRNGDTESIGVNGRAFVTEDGSLAGVFVRGVAPGGPAARAGVKPGDVITTLNGVDLGGGTLGQYCKVLRSARDNAPIAIRVVRFDSKEVLEGELNGKELALVFSFAEQLKSDVAAGSTSSGTAAAGYKRVQDDTGRISVEIPADWSDINSAAQDLLGLGTKQPTIVAAPSIADFDAGEGRGIAMIVADMEGSGTVDKDTLLDAFEQALDCGTGERANFEDDRYTGRYLVSKCADESVTIGAVLSRPANPDQIVIIIGRAYESSDLDAIDRLLSSFEAS